ncbi:MAG: glycosyltransferase [Saprospirales bacterium]|nr:glycosyltransferase [Saprospirales bacterium]
MSQPKLSVVIAVLNEEDNILPMCQRVAVALQGIDYELIFVDDGSTDGTLKKLKSLSDERLKIIELRKNYGQSLALMAGIDHASGEWIATLDGDLQNDPADIPEMLKLAEEGDWDMVAGERTNRKDDFFLRKIPSLIANWIIRQSSGVKLRDYGCALKIIRTDIARDLGLYGELHRFIPVLAVLEGARITQVPVQHHPRQFGQSKYGMGRTIKVISDLLLMLFFKRYLRRPMHLFGGIGIVLFTIGAIINLYLGWLKLLGHDIWGKPLLLLGLMLVIGGIQFITIGIVVEIQMRTYYESQQKRPYQVRKVWRRV